MKKPRRFKIVPMAGKTIDYDGQRYVLIGSEPYRRKDGQLSVILSWKSACPECGDPFVVTTGLVIRHLNRRCPLHHKKGQPVASGKRRRQGGRRG